MVFLDFSYTFVASDFSISLSVLLIDEMPVFGFFASVFVSALLVLLLDWPLEFFRSFLCHAFFLFLLIFCARAPYFIDPVSSVFYFYGSFALLFWLLRSFLLFSCFYKFTLSPGYFDFLLQSRRIPAL